MSNGQHSFNSIQEIHWHYNWFPSLFKKCLAVTSLASYKKKKPLLVISICCLNSTFTACQQKKRGFSTGWRLSVKLSLWRIYEETYHLNIWGQHIPEVRL